MSHWVETSVSSENVSRWRSYLYNNNDPGKIATLILPADTAWGKASNIVSAEKPMPGKKLIKIILLKRQKF